MCGKVKSVALGSVILAVDTSLDRVLLSVPDLSDIAELQHDGPYRSAVVAALACYRSANAGEHLFPRMRPRPPDHGRTVPTSLILRNTITPGTLDQERQSASAALMSIVSQWRAG